MLRPVDRPMAPDRIENRGIMKATSVETVVGPRRRRVRRTPPISAKTIDRRFRLIQDSDPF